ncbi:putative defensin-like protein 298 [Ricinus communis]|uniref:putative defensin-like protein 298 n=1 Tax=Ricinus communis TaxID=3988 RepID=UPI00201A600E|nr:putative defensin-like protein 298 [Ricinus communis]
MLKAYLKIALLLFSMASSRISLSKASRVVNRPTPCPPDADCKHLGCFQGQPDCTKGLCTCKDLASIVINQAKGCISDADCVRSACSEGKSSSCNGSQCVCIGIQEDSPGITLDSSIDQGLRRCRKDSDCKAICPRKCKSTDCIGGICFCSC